MTQDRLDRIEALLERFVTTSDERMTRIELESNERMTRLEQEIGDLRASLSSLRDIVVGHERRVLRLEGRDIDLWGDYMTLADRIRVLEDWKRQQERDRPLESE